MKAKKSYAKSRYKTTAMSTKLDIGFVLCNYVTNFGK
jgi:hypothetical protein